MHLKWQVPLEELSLYLYRDPHAFAAYMGYIVSRGAGKGMLGKHVGAAKKVVAFLATQSSPPWPHQQEMEAWLGRLGTQVLGLARAIAQADLPHADDVYAWVEGLVEDSLYWIKEDMGR
jgi:hypothetical protein